MSNPSAPSPPNGLLTRGLILVVLLLSGLGWLFADLASGVLDGKARDFDTAILLALRDASDLSDPIGPKWFEEMMRDFTGIGGAGVLTLVVLSAAAIFWLSNRPRSAVLLLVTVGIAIAMSQLLKAGFDRPRPDLVPHGSYVMNASFPSGHSLMSAAVYLTLGLLIARSIQRRTLRVFIVLIAILIVGLVGASRVYLGVHWPTDVLAGWALGAMLALIASLFARG